MSDLNSTRLQQCELAMLKAFVYVCDQLGLKYYLVEGTLLGAIRHQGFIPWDDDIDVAMPRCDYERFLREAPSYLPSYYFVQSFDSEPAYLANFAKIRDCRTTFIESSVKEHCINHGVYIDIFPIDYVPESRLKRHFIELANKLCTMRISQAYTIPRKKQSTLRRIRYEGIRAFAYVCYPNLRQAVLAQSMLYTACNNSTMVTNYGSAWKERERMPFEWYGEGLVRTFEGMPVRVPTEYDKWLTQVYGDYMIPPPLEKQVGHHYAEIIDLERPYTDYIQKKDKN